MQVPLRENIAFLETTKLIRMHLILAGQQIEWNEKTFALKAITTESAKEKTKFLIFFSFVTIAVKEKWI